MRRLKIVLRLVRNRFSLKDPLAPDVRIGAGEAIIFLLNLFPGYNLLCWLWIKIYTGGLSSSKIATSCSRYLVSHGLLFGALRHLAPETKNSFAAKVKPSQRAAPRDPDLKVEALASELRRTGYTNLGHVFATDAAEAAVRFFRSQRGYLAQNPLQSDGMLRQLDIEQLSDGTTERYFCFPTSTSLRCPEVATILNSKTLTELATAYLGFIPQLYSVNTFGTTRGSADHYVMRLHRDYDDFSSLTFFVYWTDVSGDSGATVYVPKSHLSSAESGNTPVYLSGSAGSLFALDTFGLHAGNKSVDKFRLATWIRFGSIPNLATIQDGWLIPRKESAILT
jgi:hypothetical protein